MNVFPHADVAEPERAHRRARPRRWFVLLTVAALVSIVASATEWEARPAFGDATPPPLGTYVGQTGSGRWIILTASADLLTFSMSVGDCQTGGGLTFTGQIPFASTFSTNGGDDPAYWMSGSFDGLGFATGIVGARRFNDDGTSCEHEETWLVSLSTPAPTTMVSTSAPTTTSTTTTTTTLPTTSTSIATSTSTTFVPVTSTPATAATSLVPTTVAPDNSAAPSSSPSIVSTTSSAAPTNPTVATSAPPSAAPALVATVADGQVMLGEPTTVQAAGFAPGERVTATLHSTPRLLGTLTADERGAVRLAVTVTIDDGAGSHDVVFVGERSGTVAVRLVATAQNLPATR